MADLYKLMIGRSKKRLRCVMIDTMHKCVNYRDALKASNLKDKWFDIIPAETDDSQWRRKNKHPWVGYNISGPKVIK